MGVLSEYFGSYHVTCLLFYNHVILFFTSSCASLGMQEWAMVSMAYRFR